MKTAVITRVIVGLLFLTIFTAGPGYAQAQTLLQGRITDQNTGYGIDGAGVRLDLEPVDGTYEYQIRADAFGFYKIRDLEAGTYTVEGSHPAYHPAAVQGVVINEGQTAKQSLELEPRSTDPVFDIYVQVTCATTGLQLSDVPVVVNCIPLDENKPSESRSALTDDMGYIHFRGLPGGHFQFAVNTGEDKRAGWDSYTSPTPEILEGPHMANVLLKPEGRSLLVTVFGYNPVTQEENVPLEGIIVEAVGVDPYDHDRELLPPITGVSGITREEGAYWDNTMATKVRFSRLVPITWEIRGKRLGYHVTQVYVTSDINAQLETSELTLNMVLQDTQITAVFNSVYNDPEMLAGLKATLQGLKDTNTAGIERQATVVFNNNRAEAVFDKILPGTYRITLNDTAEKTVPIIIDGQDVYAEHWAGPKKFSVRFVSEDYVEAFADVNHDVDVTLTPQPLTVRGQLLLVDQETAKYEYLHRPTQHAGIEFNVSEYLNIDVADEDRVHIVDADEKGEFVLTLLPGLYGIRIPGLDDYWGEAVETIDTQSGQRSYQEWPYYQTWPYSAQSVTDGFFNMGGMPLSSDQELQMQLFVRKDWINVDCQVVVWPNPLSTQVIALDTANDKLITNPYSDLVVSGAVAILDGPTQQQVPLTQDGTEIGGRFVEVTPGNYSVTVSSPRFHMVGSAATFNYWDHPAPGYLPGSQPPSPWETPHPMIPFSADYVTVDYTDYGRTAFTLQRWQPPVEDPPTQGYYYDAYTNVRPDFIKIAYAGDRIFKVTAHAEGGGVTPPSAYEVWLHFKDGEYGNEGEKWYHFTSNGGDLLDGVIKLDGPDPTAQTGQSLSVAYDLTIKAVNRADPTHEITGVNITFNDGPATKSGATLENRIEGYDFNAQSVTHGSWTYSNNSQIEIIAGAGSNPALRLTLFMDQGIAIRGMVTNEISGDPVPGAHINVVNRYGGTPIMGTPTNSEGKFTYPYAYAGKTVYFIEVQARGYEPFRKRLDPADVVPDENPKEVVHLLEGDKEIKLTPLTPPDIVTDSVSVDRFGAFLPSVKKSGDQSAFNAFNADDHLTMTWGLKARKKAHTIQIVGFDSPQDGSLSGLETKTLQDSIKEAWLIDRRSFAKNTYDDPAVDIELPSPQNPHRIHALLDKISKNDAATPNVFSQQIFRFSATEDPQVVSATGKVKLWQLPPDDFKPAFIVISRLGAVVVLEYAYSGEDQDKKLVGVRMPPWMGFLANVLGTVAGTQATAEQIKDFLPEGRFKALPAFTAEIKQEEGFLEYNYAVDVNLKEGSEGPMSGIIGLAPGMLGLNLSAGLEAGLNGKEREFSLKVQGDIERETVLKKGFTPSFFRKIGAKVDLDPMPQGTIATTASQQFDPQNYPNEFQLTHEVSGQVGVKAAVSLMPVFTKIPYVGPVLLIAHKAGLDMFANTQGLIGLKSTTTWKTIFPSRHQDHSRIVMEGEDRQLRRHFLGGNEYSGGQTKFDLCFGFGVGLAVEAGSRAGGEGTIALAGDDCWTGAPALLVESNNIGDWPPIKRVRGDVRATIKAFIDFYVGQVQKEWTWKLIKIDHQFGTETVFQLIEMNILVAEVDRNDYEPAEFIGTTPQVIRNFLLIGEYDLAGSGDGAIVFTDMQETGGDMALRSAIRNQNGSWDAPVSIAASDGAIVEIAMAPLAGGGWLAVWIEIAADDIADPYAPCTIKSATSDATGTTWSAPAVVADLSDQAVDLRLVRSGDDLALIFLKTDEGPTAEFYTVMGTTWDSDTDSWSAPGPIVEAAAINGLDAAGTEDISSLPIHIAYTDTDGKLRVSTWNGTVASEPQVLVANGAGNDVSLQLGPQNTLYLAWSSLGNGIGLQRYVSESGWTDLGAPFPVARPNELRLAFLTHDTE
ncbi:carboxypeptidase-like regulatory domain-containing protein, partial [Thermodesulfobacteriota bacterium]